MLLPTKLTTSIANTKVDDEKPTTSPDYRIDTTPLDIKISRKKAEVLVLEGKKNISSSGGAKIYEDIINLELQKAELEQEVIEFEAEKAKLEKQDPTTIKAEFKALFGDDLNANILKKFTRGEVVRLQAKLNAIRAKESPMEKWFVDAEKKLKEEIKDKLDPHDSVINLWEKSATTTNERLDNCSDNVELEKFRKAYEEAGKIIKLLESEKNEQEALRKRIAGETTPTIPPTSELDKPKLKAIFGFDANDDLLASWKSIGTFTEQKIKDNVGKYAKATSKDNFEALLAHLKDQGDVDGKKYDTTDDAKKDASWQQFIEKGPQKVVETIVNHEFESIKNDTTKLEAEKQKIKDTTDIKLEDYGGDDPDEKGIKKFMVESKLGQNHSTKSSQDDGGGSGTPTTEKTWGEWFKDWYYAPIWAPILLVVGGVAIFWKQISEWWNGPAEEQGEGKVENDEKDEENE